MLATLLAFVLLIRLAPDASSQTDLRQVRKSEQLARFIYERVIEDVSPEELLDGIRSTDKLTTATYATSIPVKEIYGTIVSERFKSELDSGFYRPGKKYEVREICAFRDAKDRVWRFHIIFLIRISIGSWSSC